MYVIEFRYPETPDSPIYAGISQGALGWATTLETALTYPKKEIAQAVLENGYGKAAEYGRVIYTDEV